MSAIGKYLGGVNLPTGTLKSIVSSPWTPTPEIVKDNGTWIPTGAVYLQSEYTELYWQLGLINASSFTPRESNTTNIIYAVASGNNTYAYGGATGAAGTSTDGVTWTAITSSGYDIRSMTYGNGVFVRGGSSGYIEYSNNATNWSGYSVTSRDLNTVNGVAVGNGLFLTAGTTTSLRTSTDSRSWTTYTPPGSKNGITPDFNGVTFDPAAVGNLTLQESTYYIPGVYSWTVPSGVSSISAVTVGGGGGGSGAAAGQGGNGADLRYSSNIAVTPGETLSIQVGLGGNISAVGGTSIGNDGLPSQIVRSLPTTSGYFDGSGDYLLTSTSSSLVPGDTFTIEMWVNFITVPAAGSYIALGSKRQEPTINNAFTFFYGGTEKFYVAYSTNGTVQNNLSSLTTFTPTAGVWYHLALVRNSGNLDLYINGTKQTTVAFSATIFNSTAQYTIGAAGGGVGTWTYSLNGYISNYRFVNGTAVYTGNFTPPTAPLTAIANTVLLTCQNTTFIDNSINNFTITAAGDATVSTTQPFTGAEILLSAAGGGGGGYAGLGPRSQYGISSVIAGNIGGGNGAARIYSASAGYAGGGGGAGGYSGNGGVPATVLASVDTSAAVAGAGSGGGGGGGAAAPTGGGRGGGVGLLGEGKSGLGSISTGTAGSPGSVGAAVYCGGGGGGYDTGTALAGQPGGVRIIWGAGRSYPNTNVSIINYDAKYVAVGLSGYIYASQDGNSWVVANSGTTTDFKTVTGGNGTYVAGGINGIITYSSDGVNWNTLAAQDYYANNINAVTSTGNLYILSGASIVKTSTDLKSWSTPVPTNISTTTLQASAANANAAGNLTLQESTYYIPGFYSWTVPSGVSSISAVTVGGGGGGVSSSSGGTGGNGADLRYSSNIAVTPGEILTIVVGAGGGSVVTTPPGGEGGVSQIWRGTSNSYSGYFDARSDYLGISDSTALQMRTGNYTIEFWWYPSIFVNFQTLFDKGGQGIGGILIQTGNGNGNIQVYSSNVASTTANITANTTVVGNAWNHVAVVRSGTTLTLYQNGNSVGSATNAANVNSTSSIYIGGSGSANSTMGYISNFRIVKGNAVYTSNFTPPTAPLTAISNTQLLTCQDTTFIDNSTNNNFVGMSGNVTSSSLSPFGNLTLILSAAGGGGGTNNSTAARPQNGFSSIITGNIGGGNGGIRIANTGTANAAGGGGAGGYSGAGGIPGVNNVGSNGAGGGGGGGGGAGSTNAGGAGGGVSLLGERASGAGGANSTAGSPGSVGAAVYCGGGAAGSDAGSAVANGQDGGVRIIWGAGRSYPNTNTSITSYDSRYIAVGATGYIYASQDSNSWIVADSKTTSTFYSAIYGNGLYVAGGVNGLLATSTNGGEWTARTSNTSSTIYSLTYGNGFYVGGTGNGRIITSTDAITWTAQTSGIATSIFSLTYGNGIFVLGSVNGALRTSNDNGNTWNSKTSGTGNDIYGLAYGANTFVRVGQSGDVGTSTDNGSNWTARTSGTVSNLNAVSYGNGLFVASGVGGTETHRYSTDGIEWFTYTSGTTNTIWSMAYGNGLYVYGAGGGKLATSTNGSRWIARTSGAASSIRSMTYGAGLYLFGTVNGGLRTSTDAITWAAQTSGTPDDIYGLAYGNGVYVRAGQLGQIASSTDAATWISAVSGSPTTWNFNSLTFGDNVFFTAGTSGSEGYRSSVNGSDWYSYTSGTTSIISAMTYGNGIYVMTGPTGIIRSSTNGEKWFMRTSAATASIYATFYGNGLYMFGGLNGMLYTSTDATTWTARTSNAVNDIYSFTYGANTYVRVGQSGDVGTSTDGTIWLAKTSGTVSNINTVNYANGVFLCGGISGFLRASTDGSTWVTRSSGNTNILRDSVPARDGLKGVFVGDSGWIGTSNNFSINQYSPGYNAAIEFYVPSVTANSFGNIENISTLQQVDTSQRIYIKAKQ